MTRLTHDPQDWLRDRPTTSLLEAVRSLSVRLYLLNAWQYWSQRRWF